MSFDLRDVKIENMPLGNSLKERTERIKQTTKQCSRCKGKGGYYTKLPQGRSTPYRFAVNNNCMVESYVTCEMPGCHNGTVNLEENYRSF